jgi:hypothetical protein
VAVTQNSGDAVLFRGSDLPHWRDAPPTARASTTLLFHYVSESFRWSLDGLGSDSSASRSADVWEAVIGHARALADRGLTSSGAPSEHARLLRTLRDAQAPRAGLIAWGSSGCSRPPRRPTRGRAQGGRVLIQAPSPRLGQQSITRSLSESNQLAGMMVSAIARWVFLFSLSVCAQRTWSTGVFVPIIVFVRRTGLRPRGPPSLAPRVRRRAAGSHHFWKSPNA